MAQLRTGLGWAFAEPKHGWLATGFFSTRSEAIDALCGQDEPWRSQTWRKYRKQGRRLVRVRVVAEETEADR